MSREEGDTDRTRIEGVGDGALDNGRDEGFDPSNESVLNESAATVSVEQDFCLLRGGPSSSRTYVLWEKEKPTSSGGGDNVPKGPTFRRRSSNGRPQPHL